MVVTHNQYRVCIGLFNSFCLIKWSAFGAIFFHYCLKYLMFSILPFFKYFSFQKVNSVAAVFICFIAIVSSCNRGILRPILGWLGGGAPFLVCLSLEFKQYLGRRLFQTLENFSLFKCPSI